MHYVAHHDVPASMNPVTKRLFWFKIKPDVLQRSSACPQSEEKEIHLHNNVLLDKLPEPDARFLPAQNDLMELSRHFIAVST